MKQKQNNFLPLKNKFVMRRKSLTKSSNYQPYLSQHIRMSRFYKKRAKSFVIILQSPNISQQRNQSLKWNYRMSNWLMKIKN